MSATTTPAEPYTVTAAREDVARQERRLRRALSDLAKAVRNQEQVDRYEPGLLTTASEITDWRIEAADRVRDLKSRVRCRQEFTASAHERLARALRKAAER